MNKKVGGQIPSIPKEFVKYHRAYQMRDFAYEIKRLAEIMFADYVNSLSDYCSKNDIDFWGVTTEIKDGDIFKNWKKYVKNA